MLRPIPRIVLLAALGDLCLLLAFSAIGRNTHYDAHALAPLGIIGTAAPFLIGWAVAGAALGTFHRAALASPMRAVTRVVYAWPLACLLGLAVRSVLEGRLVHPGFVLVALVFNLATLSIWRCMVALYAGRASPMFAPAPD